MNHKTGPTQQQLDEYLGKVVAKINEHGWMVQATFDEVTDASGMTRQVPFAYTVGLTALQKPELFVYGVPHHSAGTVLNTAAELSLEGLEPGLVEADLLAGGFKMYAVTMLDIENLRIALALYGDAVSGMQLVWPDPEHHYPWEDDFRLDPALQPVYGPIGL